MTTRPPDRHETYIRRCYDLARQAMADGNEPFGALLVHQGEILTTAYNTIHTEQDPSRHAELNLISAAARQFSPQMLANTVLYTSTEPCAMCSGAIYWAGIPAVVYGCSTGALAEIAGGGLAIPCRYIFERGRRPTHVTGPVLEAEGLAVHAGYWGRMP